MNSIVCLSHFCELHGPTAVMCTQMMGTVEASEEVAANKKSSTAGCASCQLVFPRMSGAVDRHGSSSPKPGTRDSDTGSVTISPRPSPPAAEEPLSSLRTIHGGKTFISASSPASQARFLAVRQTCLRMLSSEHTFNDSTPMMFSDPNIGSAMVINFTVADDTARGSVRRYGLICICSNQAQLTSSWTTVSSHFNAVVKKIRTRADMVMEQDLVKKQGTTRYLRNLRDFVHPPRSLVSITQDDMVFVDVHARFVRLLLELDQH